MKTIDEIAGNAAASPEEVRCLAESEPAAAARHPNCPPDLWRELVKSYPLEAMENPTLLLYSLEDPSRYSWEALEKEYAEDWIYAILPTLPEREQQLWAADCAERVLPLFEGEYPDDTRPRIAIQARRDFANGLTTHAQWESVWDSVNNVGDEVAEAGTHEYVEFAARAATKKNAVSAAGCAHRSAWEGAVTDSWNESDAAGDAELVWQWRRLLGYVRG